VVTVRGVLLSTVWTHNGILVPIQSIVEDTKTGSWVMRQCRGFQAWLFSPQFSHSRPLGVTISFVDPTVLASSTETYWLNRSGFNHDQPKDPLWPFHLLLPLLMHPAHHTASAKALRSPQLMWWTGSVALWFREVSQEMTSFSTVIACVYGPVKEHSWPMSIAPEVSGTFRNNGVCVGGAWMCVKNVDVSAQ